MVLISDKLEKIEISAFEERMIKVLMAPLGETVREALCRMRRFLSDNQSGQK